jgi:hypothetical protein
LFSKFSVEPTNQGAPRVKKRQHDLPNGIQNRTAMQQSGRREQVVTHFGLSSTDTIIIFPTRPKSEQ